jgi:adenylosuccinate lyase
MINRYEVKEISKIWSETSKFNYFLKVEMALIKALEDAGDIPNGIHANLKDAKIRVDRIDEIEKVTKHDVIAFCTSITEQMQDKYKKYFHYGVTSSDVIDTSLSLQLRDSLDIIIKDMDTLLTSLKKRALDTKELITIGRSHGIFAEPMSFGVKFLNSYSEFKRRLKDLNYVRDGLTGQFSGAVGNYTILSPTIEEAACRELGLKVEPVSSQVISRDYIAMIATTMSLIASAVEKMAVEIRHLHHSDIGELHEGFSKGQKGSSTMPHKKNPISAENVSGLARVIKSHASIALENNVLWHERDISHSSAERVYIPDMFGLSSYVLRRLASTIDNLVLNEEVIESKVKNNFNYLSSYVLHQLIDNLDVTREELYAIVQEAFFSSKNQKELMDSLNKQIKDKGQSFKLSILGFEEIKELYLKNSSAIYKRVLA